MNVLDLLFPKRCLGCRKFGSYICPDCFIKLSFADKQICAVCNRPAIDGITHPGCIGKYTLDGVIASMSYAGLMKKLLYQFKYKPHVTDLTDTLSELFFDGLIQNEQFYRVLHQKPILVPIPLHKERLRSRGYNQATILAHALSKKLSLPVREILLRQKKTESQFLLTRNERTSNMKQAFQVKKSVDVLRDEHVFLIDDVTTSGITFLEAAKVLKKEGVTSVWGIALAHGQ